MFEEKLLEPHFTSVLAPYMLDVVEQKRALGNKYNAGVEALSAFDDFCNEQQLRIPAISKELLQKWEKKRPHENETTQCFRISYVRILCKYLHSNTFHYNVTPIMSDLLYRFLIQKAHTPVPLRFSNHPGPNPVSSAALQYAHQPSASESAL